MPLQAANVDGDVRCQIDPDYVVVATVGSWRAAMFDANQIATAFKDRLGVQEARGEFGVVARRPHGDREARRCAPIGRRVAETNLERLLNGNMIILGICGIAVDFVDSNGQAAGRHSLCKSILGQRSISQRCGLQAAMRIVLKTSIISCAYVVVLAFRKLR